MQNFFVVKMQGRRTLNLGLTESHMQCLAPLAHYDMFRLQQSPLGDVNCPNIINDGKCLIPNCLFKHNIPKKRRSLETHNQAPKRAKPTTNSVPTDLAAVQTDIAFVVPLALTSGVTIPRISRIESAKRILKHITDNSTSPTPKREAVKAEYDIAVNATSADSYHREVAKFLGLQQSTPAKIDSKHAIPMELTPSPATFPMRKRYIEHLAEALRQSQPEIASPLQVAVEQEYKVASTNSTSTYNIAIKRKIYEANHPEKVRSVQLAAPTDAEILQELRNICIPVEKLTKYGYFMEYPDKIDGPEAKRTCHRCKQEFKLDEVMKETTCQYHSGKIVKDPLGVRRYLCCSGVFGETDTVPCEKASRHVFYWTDSKEMHHSQPFRKTREMWGIKHGSLDAVGIDCEMGFTSRGFELLRITAIDFTTAEEVFDVLVRPKGEIIDLNTRWSGIAEIKDEALNFEDAIELLGEIVDCNTIMIGHGLENDMNAMRLIHDKVVDTAILYPKHQTSPTFRFSLKQLAFQYLNRTIQTGEHDSFEDSLASMDVAKHFIKKDIMMRKELRKSI